MPASVDTLVDTETSERVCTVELGLTCYLADAAAWSRSKASRALEIFLSRVPVSELLFHTTSEMDVYRRLKPGVLDSIVKRLRNDGPPGSFRHQLEIEVCDLGWVPSLGYRYLEIDPTREDRASILELTFPQESDPRILREMAREIGKLGPLWSAVGGFVFRYSRYREADAFDWIDTRSQRYIGIDVQPSEEMSWNATTGLPGSNWLNIAGGPLVKALQVDTAALRTAFAGQTGITISDLPDGFLIEAGPQATLGDLNRLQLPKDYVHVAKVLEPHFAPEAPTYAGSLAEPGRAEAWFHRLADPRGWPPPP